ncbi:MAG: nucleoside deaminase [Bacteroidota bacterium]
MSPLIEPPTDEFFMEQALVEARLALDRDEIPVGAVVVSAGRVISRAHNQVEMLQDATAHAEMIAITSAMAYLGSKYLKGCVLYVTLEPCVMCAGALNWAQLGRIVYGAEDPKGGFMRFGKDVLHPKTKLEFGICEDQCRLLLTDFFRKKRRLKKT